MVTKRCARYPAQKGIFVAIVAASLWLDFIITRVGEDAGYVGAVKREEVKKKLEAMPHEVRWYIAKRRKPIREMAECWQKYWRWPLKNTRHAFEP